jgi:hypothetical protein
MTHRISFLISAALTCSATASFADVSAQDVWNNWQAFAQSMGQNYTARLEQEADTLVAYDVLINASDLAMDGMTLTGSLPRVMLQDLPNGTVEITVPEAGTYITVIKGEPILGFEPFEVRSTITMDNTVIASGTPNEISYNILPGTVTYGTEKQVKDGIAIVPEQMVTLLGVHGTTTAKSADDILISSIDIQADAVTVESNGTTELATMESSFKAAPFNITAAFTNNATTVDTSTALMESLEGNFSYAIGNTTFEMTNGDAAQMMHIVGETQEAQINATIADGSLTYVGTSTNTEVVVDGSAIPFPQVDFGIGAVEFGLTMPLLADSQPKPVGLKLAIDKLRLPEVAWMVLDPQGQMAHGPAALTLDLSGNMVSKIDLINPAAMLDMAEGDVPFQPIDLMLNKLFVSIAGATLTGSGDAVFAEDVSKSFGPAPFETANATLSLTGGIALIDTLTQSGLVPLQMSTSAKMMLGIFARPGDAPDTYISDIALQGDALTINGQPLPF